MSLDRQETRFFRDADFYQALKSNVIPEIVRQNRSRRQIRIWSASCASGQEPYSVAMIIRDHFPELAEWDVKIVASDSKEAMLERVRDGRYSQRELNRGLTAPQLIRYFERLGTTWQAKTSLRDLVEVRHLDLTRQWPYIGHFDLALLRDVLANLSLESRTGILKRVRGTVRPEGYLFVGATETLFGLQVPYRRQDFESAVCYRPTCL